MGTIKKETDVKKESEIIKREIKKEIEVKKEGEIKQETDDQIHGEDKKMEVGDGDVNTELEGAGNVLRENKIIQCCNNLFLEWGFISTFPISSVV